MDNRTPESSIREICVYCGSSPGTDTAFIAAARDFGRLLAENDIGLVYGGGRDGLMGALAAAVRDHGGHVVGIIPQFLQARERVFTGAQEVIVTNDMHERKRAMFDRADAFVALPGGIGTLEELVEQLTWAQLGRHTKPIVIVNVKGFWNALLQVLGHMKDLGFIHSNALLNYHVVDSIEDVLPLLFAAPAVPADTSGEAEVIKRL